MFLIEFLDESQTSQGNVFVKGEFHLIALSNGCVHLSAPTLDKVTVPCVESNDPLLFCCIAVCWSDCTWVTPTTREFAMWDFGHLEAMSSLSLRILQNPWYQKVCLLISPPTSSCVSWSTRKCWECCQSLREQMSNSFNSNILVSLNFESKRQHLLSRKWQYCFVHFLRAYLSDIQGGLTQVWLPIIPSGENDASGKRAKLAGSCKCFLSVFHGLYANSPCVEEKPCIQRCPATNTVDDL